MKIKVILTSTPSSFQVRLVKSAFSIVSFCVRAPPGNIIHRARTLSENAAILQKNLKHRAFNI